MIVTARKLANSSPRKPRQADLRRAISTAYYALFHAIAKDAADMLVGMSRDRPDKAWAQIYRALNHGDAKAACKQVRDYTYPNGIVTCADAFVALQEQRHAADFDPQHRVLRVDALDAIRLAEDAIRGLSTAPRRDRRAFAVLVLTKRRKS